MHGRSVGAGYRMVPDPGRRGQTRPGRPVPPAPGAAYNLSVASLSRPGASMSRLSGFVLALLVHTSAAARADERRADAFPDYRPVAGWPQLPAKTTLGPVSAVATDAKDRVYVAHRGPKPVMVFEP